MKLNSFLSCSSANAKKWEAELQTLKNNNAKLTAALQESTVNVEKWKEQLNNYREENLRLKKKVNFIFITLNSQEIIDAHKIKQIWQRKVFNVLMCFAYITVTVINYSKGAVIFNPGYRGGGFFTGV